MATSMNKFIFTKKTLETFLAIQSVKFLNCKYKKKTKTLQNSTETAEKHVGHNYLNCKI